MGRGAAAVRAEAGAPSARVQACEAVELALWMGRLLMDNGAESERVAHSVRGCGAQLGSKFGAVLVGYEALVVSHVQGDGHVTTSVCNVRPAAVNMSLIEALSHVSHRIARGELNAPELRRELERIERAPRHYPPLLTGLCVALACAAFSRLFQGDWGAFAMTFAGAGGAMWLRHQYAKRKPNRLFFAGVSAAVAAFVVGMLQQLFALSDTPAAAIVASGLMLVPGVPAINAAQDMIKGHLGVAIARACEAALIVLSAALGLLLGIGLSGVQL